MVPDRRVKKSKIRKFSRYFYYAAIFAFASFALLNIGMCLYNGFTDERIALLMLNLWFIFYTMNMITRNFRREEEQVFWHDWVMFSSSIDEKEEVELEEVAIEDTKKVV